MDFFAPIAEQRRRVADALVDLTPAQWSTPSLCAAWTVHDVVAHLDMVHITPLPRVVWEMAKARGNFSVANQALTARVAKKSSTELVDLLRQHAEGRFTPPGHNSLAPLTDLFVHTYDIFLPLGIPAPDDERQWPIILEFLLSPRGRKGFVVKEPPALNYITTDGLFSHGAGEIVTGSGPALALALMGRTALVDDLSGPGAESLSAWLATF